MDLSFIGNEVSMFLFESGGELGLMDNYWLGLLVSLVAFIICLLLQGLYFRSSAQGSYLQHID